MNFFFIIFLSLASAQTGDSLTATLAQSIATLSTSLSVCQGELSSVKQSQLLLEVQLNTSRDLYEESQREVVRLQGLVPSEEERAELQQEIDTAREEIKTLKAEVERLKAINCTAPAVEEDGHEAVVPSNSTPPASSESKTTAGESEGTPEPATSNPSSNSSSNPDDEMSVEDTNLTTASPSSSEETETPEATEEPASEKTEDPIELVLPPKPIDLSESSLPSSSQFQVTEDELSSHYLMLVLNSGALSMKVGVDKENQIQFQYRSAAGESYGIEQDFNGLLALNATDSSGASLQYEQADAFNFTVVPNSTRGGLEVNYDPSPESSDQIASFKGLTSYEMGHLEVNSLGLDLYLSQNPDSFATPNSTEETKKSGFSYAHNGADWALEHPTCATEKQSPIDLLPPKTSYGHSYKYLLYNNDNLYKDYSDLTDFQLVKYPSIQRVEIKLHHRVGQYHGFASALAASQWKISEQWDAYEMSIKHNSEHTVGGKRFDLEFQIFHIASTTGPEQATMRRRNRRLQEEEASGMAEEATSPSEEEENESALSSEEYQEMDVRKEMALTVDYSAVSIFFDTENYDKSLTEEEVNFFYYFFDSLRLDEENPVLEDVEFGKLMNRVDFSQRWMYKGSRTTPPCKRYVIWHVLHKVYPIRRDQLAEITRQWQEMGVQTSGGKGNVRDIQIGFNDEVFFVKTAARQLKWIWTASIFAVIFLLQ